MEKKKLNGGLQLERHDQWQNMKWRDKRVTRATTPLRLDELEAIDSRLSNKNV